MVATRLITVEDLEAMGNETDYGELVDGELRPLVSSTAEHMHAASELVQALIAHLISRETNGEPIGEVFHTQASFVTRRDPVRGDTVRMPDVAYITAERWRREATFGQIPRFVPDLAVEIRSKDDSLRELHEKAREYLEAGVRLVWLIDPYRRKAHVVRPGQEPTLIPEDGKLDGEDLLPGFTVPLATLFL